MKKYSQDFVQRVKAAYPGFQRLHDALDNNSDFVGRYLDDSTGTMSPAHVLELIDGGKVAELREEAQALAVRGALYGEWSRDYYGQALAS